MKYFVWTFLLCLFLYFTRNVIPIKTAAEIVANFLILAVVSAIVDCLYYFQVLRKPVLSSKGTIINKEVDDGGEGSDIYIISIITIDKKKLRLHSSFEQYEMLNLNDIVYIKYQGYVLCYFQRKTDKLPIINKRYKFSKKVKSKKKR